MRRLRFAIILLLLAAAAAQGQAILPTVNGFDAYIGEGFSQQFSYTGVSPSLIFVSWAVTTGSLPPGLSLNTTTGLVSGTPTTAGVYTATITANFTTVGAPSIYPYSRSYAFYVEPRITFVTPTPLAAATAGTAMTRTIVSSSAGGWDTYANTMPQAIQISLPTQAGSSATLSGTFPTVTSAATYSVGFVIHGLNTSQSVQRVYAITVNPAPVLNATVPTGQVGASYNGALTVSGGTSPYTYSLVTGSLPPGLGLNGSTGVISGIASAAGVYNFTGRVVDANGAVSTRTTSVTVSGPALSVATTQVTPAILGRAYSFNLIASGGAAPYLWSITNGTLPNGLTLDSSGLISGTPGAIDTKVITVRVSDAQQNTASATLTVVVNGPPLTISTTSLPAGLVGTFYSISIGAQGGVMPYTFSIASGTLPAGLSLRADGVLSGLPTAAESANFTVRVTDSQQVSATAALHLEIERQALSIVTVSLPDATMGAFYSSAVTAQGGTAPYTMAMTGGALPPGISLRSDGVVSGTPTGSGLFTFAVTATDGQKLTATRQLTLRVNAPTNPAITTESLPDGVVGTAYATAIGAMGGVPPYAFSISEGVLPAGLALSQGGTISGTPTAPGTSSFSVTVRDSGERTGSRTLRLTILAAVQFTTTGLPDGRVGTAYTGSLAATGGAAPYVYSLVSGALPEGITLASTGALAGTPATAGRFEFVARVADAARRISDGVFAIVVAPRVTGPAITTLTLPDGVVGSDYTAALAGSGVAPLAWSVSSGTLPPGLSLSASGTLAGKPTAAGAYNFTVRLADGNAPQLSATRALAVTIGLPALPPASVTQLTDTVAAGAQPAFGVALSQAYPVDLSGTATLVFTPEGNAPQDPDVKFASGGTTMNFTIAAGQTAAVAASGSVLALQTGTTAGTITLSVTLRQGTTVVQPNPAATRTIRINRAAPVLSSVRINRTSSGFEVLVTGFTNTREITSALFRFTAAAGSAVTSSDVTVAVQPVFQSWFASTASQGFGGQFLLTVPFSVTGSVSSLASVQVTLTNSVGSATGSANF